MADLVSQQLEKASEDLRQAMQVHAKINIQLQTLKSKFVGASNPLTKEKMKPLLIAATRKEKLAKAALARAESIFQDTLKTEPEEMVDLLDHKLKEHYLRLLIRGKLKEHKNESKSKR